MNEYCTVCGDKRDVSEHGVKYNLGVQDAGSPGGQGACGDCHRWVTPVLNLTQHPSSAEQAAEGVYDLDPQEKQELSRLLTFNAIPTPMEMDERAMLVWNAAIAALNRRNCRAVMLGGAPFFMSSLERQFQEHGVKCLYAFSVRESVEEKLPDGGVKKVAVFRHKGFVRV